MIAKLHRVPPHVLVVEDEPSLAAVIADILRDEGYRVSVAGNGLAALRMALQDQPTLVVSDIKMPGGDGLSMIRRFREHASLLPVPVMFFSSAPEEREARRLGAYRFVRKPVSREELVSRVFEGVCTGFVEQQH